MVSPGSVRITWSGAEFRRILDDQMVPNAVWRAAGRVRDRTKTNITAAGRIDTGAMRNDIQSRRIWGGRIGVWYEVGGTLPYTIFQHQGVDGPILPRRAKVLRFKPGGSSTFIFRPQVNGFKGEPFLTDALGTLSLNDFLP